MRLEQALKSYGFEGTVEEFCDAVVETYQRRWPSWTIDRLMANPSQGLILVGVVRQYLKCNTLPEELICQTLFNLRKRGGSPLNGHANSTL